MFAVFVLAGVSAGVLGRAARPTSRAHRDVGTTQGVVRGYLNPEPPHYAFLGLPYGGPPTRYDRFKAPKPPARWDGIFEATHRVKCPQPDGEGVENCLVLNVFTPEHVESSPVLVVVHDGSVRYGWGSFHAPVRLLRESVLVITVNYRLGALGFLCLGTSDAPGNAGLKDLVAALYWIHKNIANFGGNPLDVTVYGFGFGATAVELILLSGLGKGFLHKVILESGTALSPMSISYDPLSTAVDVSATLGYRDTEDETELSRLFRKAAVEQLMNTSLTFLPCIENTVTNAFIDMDPVDILQRQNYHKVPMLIVFTESVKITKLPKQLFNSIPENFEYLLPNNLEFNSDELRHKIGQLVKHFYFGETVIDDSLFRIYEEYFRDVIMEYPVMKSAVLHAAASSNPVFLMKFSYKCNSYQADDIEIDGDCKILDYFYIKNELYGSTDELVIKKIVTMWSNFIKIGDPTPLVTSLIPFVWQPVAANDGNPINRVTGLIFGDTITITDSMATDRITFWDNIYRKFYKQYKNNTL
ncbi:esterase E4-like [Galleria mellonella]|uniref:Esterase E4-like n=1 Tax=Galleria mellonella TaxID=7137 RepID=A0ABM3MZQ3_GALME|nr:esterase E4-like [Galleria mellonella]